jgi:predicted alpha/beta superfamily hydrolase
MYLASSWNGWDPADPNRRLERRSDGKWQIDLTPPEADAASIAFKFTMGSWDREELSADGEPIANRLLEPIDASRLAPGERPVIELQVIRFRTPEEARAPRSEVEMPIEAVGTVRRLELIGGAGRAAGLVRNAQVWLPPGYDDPANADRRYPVLYMLDGQNMFDTPAGGFGEWRADESATRLIEQGVIEPLIIVGIPHAGLYRSDEYSPFAWVPNAQPSGAAFEAWLLTHVIPRAERAFRIAEGPANTAIGGSSLGGVMSLYIATRHPDRFGLLLAESVATMGGPGSEFSQHIDATEAWPRRVYLGMGGEEARGMQGGGSQQYTDWATSIERRALATRNPPEVLCRIVPDHTHNEEAWAARLPEALEFLFPKR